MKNVLPYFIATMLLLAFGCKKNQDITQVDIIDPEPTELNSNPLGGRVINSISEPVPQAEVTVYQNGAAYTSTTTNDEGYYEFPIGSFPVENVIVSARKPQYFDNYQRVDKSSEEPVNISLLPIGQQGLQSSSLNPMDSMVLLSGQFINQQTGEGQSEVYVILYDDVEFLGFTISDDNGDFSLLTEKDKPFKLVASSACQQGQFDPIAFPPLQNDTTLAPLSGDFIDGVTATFSGGAVDCNGNALNGGTVEFRYRPGTLNRVEYPLEDDGTFSFSFSSCGIDTENPVSIVIYDEADEKFGSTSFLYDGSAQIDVGEISVCDQNGQFFQFSTPDTTFQLQEEWTVFEALGKRFIGYSNNNGVCQLIFEYSEETGTYPLESFYFADYENNYASLVENNGNVEISEVSPTQIVGTFSGAGNFNDQSNVPIQGSFNILFE